MSTHRAGGAYDDWDSHHWMEYDTFEEVSAYSKLRVIK